MLKRFSNQNGFTLYEVIIATAIILIISAVSIAGLSKSSEYFVLEEAVTEVMNLYKEAQSSAINIVEDQGEFVGQFGVFVDSSIDNQVIFYADHDGSIINDEYDYPNGSCPEDSECMRLLQFNREIKINEVRVKYLGGGYSSNVRRADILFKRPRPTANLSDNGGAHPDTIKQVEVELINKAGHTKSVIIGITGYIYIE